MSNAPSTVWEVLDAAAAGSTPARDAFVRSYGAFIRDRLGARWKGTRMLASLDDAAQEVLVECLKPNGVLARADRASHEGFRALLGAVVRNVALRAEAEDARRRRRQAASLPTVVLAHGSSVGRAVDRRDARELVREAAAEQARRAESIGDGARRRVDLLRLHFEMGMSIPEIAALWQREPSFVHHQYAKARADFQRALMTVLAARFPGLSDEELRARCTELAGLLGSG